MSGTMGEGEQRGVVSPGGFAVSGKSHESKSSRNYQRHSQRGQHLRAGKYRSRPIKETKSKLKC